MHRKWQSRWHQKKKEKKKKNTQPRHWERGGKGRDSLPNQLLMKRNNTSRIDNVFSKKPKSIGRGTQTHHQVSVQSNWFHLPEITCSLSQWNHVCHFSGCWHTNHTGIQLVQVRHGLTNYDKPEDESTFERTAASRWISPHSRREISTIKLICEHYDGDIHVDFFSPPVR